MMMSSKLIQWACLLQSRPRPHCRDVGGRYCCGVQSPPGLRHVGSCGSCGRSLGLRGLAGTQPLSAVTPSPAFTAGRPGSAPAW